MANRERKNELKIYLSDKEQYILEQKVKISGMKSKSTFPVSYTHLRAHET